MLTVSRHTERSRSIQASPKSKAALDGLRLGGADNLLFSTAYPAPRWNIEAVPGNTGFDEKVTTLILGSRRPILFTEGTENSLDLAIYRCCFSNWTVIPRGSCEEVSPVSR
jgi:hypothetical protein